ncbi:class F sortase [Kitasatospora camelliae]|uniref:Class F sortase n=1 Tax=Kitasatospora camelliae TaxID=3156397 RepID=A0AAU8JWH8_9ACTN
MGNQEGGGTPADGSMKLFRWAMAAAVAGLVLIYQSVDETPVTPATAAVAPVQESPSPSASPAGSPTASPTPRPTAVKATGPAMFRSKPVSLRIPQLFVDAPFTELGLKPDGTLETPPVDNRNLVGWYRGGASPGERGSAVVAGHVDTTTGPAVFLMLHVLLPGSTVEVVREDRTVAVFVVDAVKTYKKSEFPDKEVYGDTGSAQLRLITCGGAYDRASKDYTDNVVVFAHLKTARRL